MARSKKTKRPGRPLSTGRPPLASRPTASLSAAATRNLIRSHHRLHKALHRAESTEDSARAGRVRAEIEALGGLERYQQASMQGQAGERGGDSSVVLMRWLKGESVEGENVEDESVEGEQVDDATSHPRMKRRMLEVGALSAHNACSRAPDWEVERIDLRARGEGIVRQDFMQRPVPEGSAAVAEQGFDVVSLSLVLNYVPDAAGRGDMLRRTRGFLRRGAGDGATGLLPAVFVVLPAPCVLNSRYLDEQRLGLIMGALGFVLARRKVTAKLVYYLWRLDGDETGVEVRKEEVNPGGSRNNFSIVLEAG